MEEVCLNSEPIFDDGDEYEVKEDCDSVKRDKETGKGCPDKAASVPTVGLEFDSFDGAYDFYNVYAREQGFGIRVSNSWFRSTRKERYRAKLSCSSAGFKKKSEANNPRPETRTGCSAMIIVRLVDSKMWRIVEVELNHNHPVSPQSRRFYKSHKKMIAAARSEKLPPEPVTEMHTIKLYQTAVTDAGCGSCSSFDEKRIYVDRARHLKLKEGDAHALYNFFCRMKLTKPNFYYLMDLDDSGCLRNVFWADARSRAAYCQFFDTIAIDTTCLANKFEIPLISFVGVNHHGQTVLLGCGFIGHETTEYFVWILRAWLKCMQGCPPKVIITDQCKFLQSAVSEVFAEALHCFSVVYIMQRVPERLGGLPLYEEIKRQLQEAVYDSLKIAEFEAAWGSLIQQHELHNNKWLQTLYKERHQWAPVYLKDIFFAGMILTHENEGSSSFFDGYVHKHTSFKEYLDKYDLALHRNHLKEAMADLESRSSTSELKTSCNFEVQLANLYTKEIFRRFQSEVEGMHSCFDTRQVNVTGPIVTYLVKERVEVDGSKKVVKHFEVLFETSQLDVRCICSLFNYGGYLCRHALNVLNHNAVEEIPSRYILPRWCKDPTRRCIPFHGSTGTNVHTSSYWCNDLYNNAIPVIEGGALSPLRYNVVLQELEQLLNKLNLVWSNSL